MALRFASKKCKIAVVDIERNAAERTANEIAKNNGTAVAYCVSCFFYLCNFAWAANGHDFSTKKLTSYIYQCV